MSKEKLTGTKMKGTVDHVAAHELFLFIQNDSQLYRQEQAIDKNLRLKLKRGVFDKALAVKLFMYLADAGAHKYVVGESGYLRPQRGDYARTIDSTFSRKTRFAVAAMLTKYWIDARRNEGVHVNPAEACEICGKGAASCAFEKGCSCWRGIPCKQKVKGGMKAAKKAFKDHLRNCAECQEAARGPLTSKCPVSNALWKKTRPDLYGNPISRRTAHRVMKMGLDAAQRRGWVNPGLHKSIIIVETFGDKHENNKRFGLWKKNGKHGGRMIADHLSFHDARYALITGKLPKSK